MIQAYLGVWENLLSSISVRKETYFAEFYTLDPEGTIEKMRDASPGAVSFLLGQERSAMSR
jgi:hypothetical protein